MASIAGTVDPLIRPDIFVKFPGRTVGFGVPFHQFAFVFEDMVPVSEDVTGVVTADQEGSPPASVEGSIAGTTDQDIVFGSIWFDLVHLIPRTKFEFGNIVSQVEDTFEIYNAFRTTSVTLTSITNNLSPGVVFPTITPPVEMPPSTSILDPTTTDNSGGVGLGTLVETAIRVLQDGIPQFDTDAIFVTTQNDPFLLASGSRIVLFDFDYEGEVRESLAFLTDVIPGLDGNEQRIALRKQPRQTFDVEYALDAIDRQRMQVLLFDWMDNNFGFPLWRERLLLTAATIVGATTYPVSGADDVDFRVGELAVVLTDATVFDVFVVSVVTDTLITASSPAVNAYPIGTRIAPVRTAVIPNRVATQRAVNNLERFRLTFEVTDNDTGAPAGSTTPGFWSTFNSRVLFDDCNVVDSGGTSGSLRRRIHRLDNQTGIFAQTSLWDRNKRGSEKGFFARSRAEINSLRNLFRALRGKQKAFYLPTFIEDLTPNADLVLGLATMDIVSVGYVRFVRDRLPLTIFRISFTDGTSLVRTVQSSATVSATVERLTLDTTWPANRTIAEISRIEWYELVRFDSDKMVLRYPNLVHAQTRMPILRVFDDNV